MYRNRPRCAHRDNHIDSVTRAMQSLCENNVLGIIVNGARRGELYSKYTYYHSYYYAKPEEAAAETAPTP